LSLLQQDEGEIAMNILVIGGTHFLGPWVVKGLYEKGHTVTLFHRGQTEGALPPHIAHLHSDRKDLFRFREHFQAHPPDVVLDMFPFTQQDAQQVRETFQGCARRVVAISSADVYRAYGRVLGTEPGPADAVPLSEDAPLREKLFPYRGKTLKGADDPTRWMDDYDKLLVEQVIMQIPQVPGTILRLPMVYGPGDPQHRLFPYLKRMDDRRPHMLLDEGTASWRWTRGYVENIAAAIVAAVLSEQAAGRLYNVGEPETLPISQWVRLIGQAVGWTGEVVTLPKQVVPAHLMLPLHTHQHMMIDSTRIRQELGYAEPIPPAEALQRTIRWERAHPPEHLDPGSFDYAAEDALLREWKQKNRV
jgi:nucleoside-diphosphate-sugar epimerase